MAGTWMSVVYGFGGFSTENGIPKFKPFLPEKWNGLNFHMMFRERLIVVSIDNETVAIELVSGDALTIEVYDQEFMLGQGSPVKVSTK